MKLHAAGGGVFPDLLPELLLPGDRIDALEPDRDAVEGEDNGNFAVSLGLSGLDGLDRETQAFSCAAVHEREAGFVLVAGHDFEGAAAAKSGLPVAATVGCGSRGVGGPYI